MISAHIYSTENGVPVILEFGDGISENGERLDRRLTKDIFDNIVYALRLCNEETGIRDRYATACIYHNDIPAFFISCRIYSDLPCVYEDIYINDSVFRSMIIAN